MCVHGSQANNSWNSTQQLVMGYTLPHPAHFRTEFQFKHACSMFHQPLENNALCSVEKIRHGATATRSAGGRGASRAAARRCAVVAGEDSGCWRRCEPFLQALRFPVHIQPSTRPSPAHPILLNQAATSAPSPPLPPLPTKTPLLHFILPKCLQHHPHLPGPRACSWTNQKYNHRARWKLTAATSPNNERPPTTSAKPSAAPRASRNPPAKISVVRRTGLQTTLPPPRPAALKLTMVPTTTATRTASRRRKATWSGGCRCRPNSIADLTLLPPSNTIYALLF